MRAHMQEMKPEIGTVHYSDMVHTGSAQSKTYKWLKAERNILIEREIDDWNLYCLVMKFLAFTLLFNLTKSFTVVSFYILAQVTIFPRSLLYFLCRFKRVCFG